MSRHLHHLLSAIPCHLQPMPPAYERNVASAQPTLPLAPSDFPASSLPLLPPEIAGQEALQEMCTYLMPMWLAHVATMQDIYGMSWGVRPDKRFRLAVGSFIEEYRYLAHCSPAIIPSALAKAPLLPTPLCHHQHLRLPAQQSFFLCNLSRHALITLRPIFANP